MAKTAVATLQTIWDCRWSRPRARVTPDEHCLQPESLWVCVRTGERRPVTEAECEGCPYWETEDHED